MEKKKKTFQFTFLYKNLTPYGKFRRTAWISILGILICAAAFGLCEDKEMVAVLTVIFFLADLAQLRSTYREWKS